MPSRDRIFFVSSVRTYVRMYIYVRLDNNIAKSRKQNELKYYTIENHITKQNPLLYYSSYNTLNAHFFLILVSIKLQRDESDKVTLF